MTPDEANQCAEFSKVQQAIREDDMWLAAWLMARFTRKLGYKITKNQLEWLEREHIRRCDEVRQACIALEKTAQKNAQDDFHNWLDNASPFQDIEYRSWLKHCEGEDVQHLKHKISIYSRAAGYLREIINLAGQKPKRDPSDDIQLDAMGSAPSTKSILA